MKLELEKVTRGTKLRIEVYRASMNKFSAQLTLQDRDPIKSRNKLNDIRIAGFMEIME